MMMMMLILMMMIMMTYIVRSEAVHPLIDCYFDSIRADVNSVLLKMRPVLPNYMIMLCAPN